jgi:protein TonB
VAALPVVPTVEAAMPVVSSTTETVTESAEPAQVADAPETALTPETVQPVQAEPEQVTADEPVSAAVATSLRPKMRTPSFEEAHKPAAKPKPAPRRQATAQPKPKKPKPATPAPRGNADRSARAGQATGTERASSVSSGTGGKSKSAGNAAASNYPGIVMRKISRVRRPRGVRGTATVSYRISSSGGLAGASISRSSGSAKLDKAALQIVRRAAPFPKPPAGARRSFSVKIKGR